MTWLFVIVIAVVLGVTVVVSAGHGGDMRPVHDDRRDVTVPNDRPVEAADLDRVRFTTAVRGYRMDEVDELLARLRAELAEREDASGPTR